MARKKTLFITLIAAAVLVSSSAVFAAEKTFLSIATGGTSGTYYPIGGAIAQAVSKGGVVQATAETSNASVANVNLVATKEIEIAFVQNDITFWAYTGEMMFKSPQLNLRAIAALYPEHVQLITTKNSGIKVIDDLKGKRVGVGAPGSGTEGDVRAIMQVAGLSYDDMKTDFLDFGATTSRFKDNQIDAGFVVAGFPTASVMDLATTKDITLLNFTPEYLDKLVKEFPYFIKSSVPGGTYMGIDNDIATPAVMAILITHDEIPEDVVYEFTKSMFDNIADIHAAHAKGKEITLKTALDGLTVPLHPGAAKYFKEQGMSVD